MISRKSGVAESLEVEMDNFRPREILSGPLEESIGMDLYQKFEKLRMIINLDKTIANFC